MATITVTNFPEGLDAYLFTAHNPIYLEFEVAWESVTEKEEYDLACDIDYIGKPDSLSLLSRPILIQDLSDVKSIYFIYLDKMIKPIMEDFSDISQSLESEIIVSNITKSVEFSYFLVPKNFSPVKINDTIIDVTLIHAAHQFGDTPYLCKNTDLTQYLNNNLNPLDDSIQTPLYNYDKYYSAANFPFYIQFLISSDLDDYYDFYLGDKFLNSYASNHDDTLIFTNENNVYYII
jgi:hypothetical protein